MRKIKFKAIDTLGNLVYGLPTTSSTLHLTLDNMAQFFTEQRLYSRENVQIIPETLSQYTGVSDKNGKEIYENDRIVIKGENKVFIVKFERSCFCIFEINDMKCYGLLCNVKNIIVVESVYSHHSCKHINFSELHSGDSMCINCGAKLLFSDKNY